jgi:hypothetical protein
MYKTQHLKSMRHLALGLSNLSLRAASIAGRGSKTPCHWSPEAKQNVHVPVACTTIKNANGSIAATRFVRVMHPFHPLSGHQMACVGERYNRYGMTLLLESGDGSIYSVPPQWTDLVSPDPEIVIGKGRALYRVVDLLELALLMDRLRHWVTSGDLK